MDVSRGIGGIARKLIYRVRQPECCEKCQVSVGLGLGTGRLGFKWLGCWNSVVDNTLHSPGLEFRNQNFTVLNRRNTCA